MRNNLHLLRVYGAAGLAFVLASAPGFLAQATHAQGAPISVGPIAIVPMDAKSSEATPEVTGDSGYLARQGRHHGQRLC